MNFLFYSLILVLELIQAGGMITAQQQSIVGYLPTSQITDHAALDLDQMRLNEQVYKRQIANARRIYEQGGHSFSYAEITLQNLTQGNTFEASTSVIGITSQDPPAEVSGTLMEPVSWSDGTADAVVKVQYDTSDIQSDYVNCQVGGLYYIGEANREGCKLAV